MNAGFRKILATLSFLYMVMNRIGERKMRDRPARRAQIIDAARKVAEQEGWPNVTVRRLADEISYTQPVLYSHFENRDAIIAAAAIEGFQELGSALEKARQRVKPANPIETLATAYLHFAAASPALYEAMFSLRLSVPFANPKTPPELHFAFSQVLELFSEQSAKAEVLAESFWASLHGIADLTRTKRLPPKRQKERLRACGSVQFSNGRDGAGAEIAIRAAMPECNPAWTVRADQFGPHRLTCPGWAGVSTAGRRCAHKAHRNG